MPGTQKEVKCESWLHVCMLIVLLPTITELQRKPRRTGAGWSARAHLSLQLSHSGCEVEHQPGDVLKLVLQDMDGIGLLLVLEVHTHSGQQPYTDIPL